MAGAPVETAKVSELTACGWWPRLPSTRIPLAPPDLFDFLSQLADDECLLPPWTSWWNDADVTGLFPDFEVRDRVEREQQRLPLSYFSQSLPVPTGWDNRPGAYRAFGDTYLSERQDAAARGWPVHTISGAA